jgi:C-terminal processing protease CtpA/Prc
VEGVNIELFGGKPFIVKGDRAGSEVVEVDGMSPELKMETLRLYLRACSSERAYRREAARSLLAGKEPGNVEVKLRLSDGRTETVTWKRTAARWHGPLFGDLPLFLTKQRYVNFGRYPSGVGYIQIESFNVRKEVDDEFERALDSLRDTSALIVDIRNNLGGFGHPKIEGRFFRKRTRVGFSYVKNGARHTDFDRREVEIGPSGKWQYTRPVALLINDVTGSASDLFTTEVRAAPQVTVIGTTTHGNLSGVAAYAVLPCGLVVRISNGYISNAKDQPIEGNGNAPDMVIEPTIDDVLHHRDPVLDGAIQLLSKSAAK